MQVTIVGPNVAFDHGCTFEIHKAGCADLKRGKCKGAQRWDLDATGGLSDIVLETYPPNDFEWDASNDKAYDNFACEFHICPCANDLPDEYPSDEEVTTTTRGSTTMPAAKRTATATAKKSITVEVEQDRETKNAYRFAEVLAKGQDRGVIGSIYILKADLEKAGLDPEATLMVTVTEAEEEA